MWGYNGYGYPMMGYGDYGVTHAIFSVFWAVIVVAFIVFVVRAVRRGKSPFHCHHCGSENTALDILKERYAKGEIDKAEFEAKKKDLSA